MGGKAMEDNMKYVHNHNIQNYPFCCVAPLKLGFGNPNGRAFDDHQIMGKNINCFSLFICGLLKKAYLDF